MSLEDSERLVDRLQYAIVDEVDTRLSFLVGSGLSIGAIPDTRGMVEYFCRQMGSVADRFQKKYDELTAPEAYRSAAEELKQRRGEKGLANAVRAAIATSCTHPDASQMSASDLATLPPDHWNITAAHRGFGRLVRLIPVHRRGPIFTTNFDHQIELALSAVGVPHTTISVVGSAAFPLDGISGSVPIVHLHGYWQNSATLSTPSQLSRPRPGLEELLKLELSASLMTIVGYGGWGDAFTRALSEFVRQGKFSALQSEILWTMFGEENEPEPPLLQEISGAPGVQKYYGISAAPLFDDCFNRVGEVAISGRDSYSGWVAVPREYELQAAETEAVRSFVEGKQPSWNDAKALGRLGATDAAIEVVHRWILERRDGIIALVGPTGEGKSLALRQIGLATASDAAAEVVLYRDVVARGITTAWLTDLRGKASSTVLLIDEADLVLRDMSWSFSDAPSGAGSLIFVLAVHGHYEGQVRDAAKFMDVRLELINMAELTHADSLTVAGGWKELGLLPAEYGDMGREELADWLRREAATSTGRSLYGAVLHLWMTDELVSRVGDLMQRLDRSRLLDRSYRDLLLAIALIQDAWDPDATGESGITIGGLAAFAGLQSQDVIPMVVAPLGREAGIAQIGNRIYVRHPAMVDPILDCINIQDILRVARDLGSAGGRLRRDLRSVRKDSREMYHLCSRLEGRLALAAARGAVEGAPDWLEPRVSYIATARKNGKLELAANYSAQLEAHLTDYYDLAQSVRGYWVERSVVSRMSGNMDEAIYFAAKASTDLSGAHLDDDRFFYALVNVAIPTGRLGSVSNRAAGVLLDAVHDILILMPGARERYHELPNRAPQSSTAMGMVRAFHDASRAFIPRDRNEHDWEFSAMLVQVGRLLRRYQAEGV